ncbi:MAG: ATP-binding protein [Thaumarchaeota archaeon]|nr:ATP-binding protein [Nitrososphaerota archaeon]
MFGHDETTDTRKFDLNIEEVLEGWEPRHAIREIIANALDEQSLTGTQDIEIRKHSDGHFTVRDWGRGIRPEHLTQNENPEKISGSVPVIGRFGVGLKDALAVLSRRSIGVRIRSRHCTITVESSGKHGFENIETLHALVAPPDDTGMDGTEVELENADPREMAGARSLFRKFSEEEMLESTKYGDVLERLPGEPGRVYVNGVRVATEDNFLFSYDITKPTEKMRRMLNRERTNVGRQAYTERVKSILMEVRKDIVVRALANDVGLHEVGEQHDETKYTDVAVRACKLLNASGNVVFATAAQQRQMSDIMDKSRRDDMRVITVPDNVGGRLVGASDESGVVVRDVGRYMEELNERFEFKFVKPADLADDERRVWDKTGKILELANFRHLSGGVRISETMRPGHNDANGIWDGDHITIKRSALSDLEGYAGVLLHEAAHALGCHVDVTREFELDLTRLLGDVAVRALRVPPGKSGAVDRTGTTGRPWWRVLDWRQYKHPG